MNLRDLTYLIAIENHRHFGKAAKASFVSQPTLSMQIKKLEDSLGVKLVERNNKNIMLTSVGKEMASIAREILLRVEHMKEIAKNQKNPFAGELKLGIIPTVAPYLLPRIMPTLTKKFPELTIYLIEEQTKHILADLKEGKLDAGILALPIEDDSLRHENLYSEQFLLAVPNKHDLANRKYIRESDLTDRTILLLEEGHCLRDQALVICNSAAAKEQQNFRATSLETLRHMVTSGIGITLIPELAAQEKNAPITYIPFHKPKPTRTIALFWRKSSVRTVLFKEMSKLITHEIVK